MYAGLNLPVVAVTRLPMTLSKYMCIIPTQCDVCNTNECVSPYMGFRVAKTTMVVHQPSSAAEGTHSDKFATGTHGSAGYLIISGTEYGHLTHTHTSNTEFLFRVLYL